MTKRTPSVAVCIPTFNQSEYVEEAVESAILQCDVQTEVWISDDASSDSTATILEKFAGNPRVHLLRQSKNTGIAFNAGLVMSQPKMDFVVRLDSDDVLHSNYCKKLVALLDSNPKAGVAHCAVQEIDAKGTRGRVRRLARRSGFQQAEEALRGSSAGYRVAANICMFRRSALDRLDFIFNQKLNFCEDWDLYARLAASGWGNVYTTQVLANYRVWEDAAGYRASRKAAEISGIHHVMSATLSEAWEQRGWPTSDLESARIRFACAHAGALLNFPPDTHDYRHIYNSLIDLEGNNGEFIAKIISQLKRRGFFRKLADQSKLRLRDFLKAILYH